MDASKLGEYLFPRAVGQDPAVLKHHDVVRKLKNTLLMRDNQYGLFSGLSQLVKGIDQHRKAPQVDARFRFVKNRKGRFSCQKGRDLDPLQLAARQGRVDLTVDIFSCTEADLGKIFTADVLGKG